MARPLQSFVIFVLFQFLFFSNIIILGEANEDSDLMEFANHALAAGKYEAAEDFFEKIFSSLIFTQDQSLIPQFH